MLFSYLDPGAGSMLLQLIVGGLAGLGVVLKFYGQAIVDFCRGCGKPPSPTEAPSLSEGP
jgi:hypothetical protein